MSAAQMRLVRRPTPGRVAGVSTSIATQGMPTAHDSYHARLARVVAAVRGMATVDLLSTSLDPATGAIRVELYAPCLPGTDRSSVSARLQVQAGENAREQTIRVEFVDAGPEAS